MKKIIIVLVLMLHLPVMAFDKNDTKLVKKLISSYYPNFAFVLYSKKINIKDVRNKLKIKKDKTKKIVYEAEAGTVKLWFNTKGYLSSSRFIIKKKSSKLLPNEKKLLTKYKREVTSLKARLDSHNKVSIVKDTKKDIGLFFNHPNKYTEAPRIVEVYLGKRFFR